MTASNLIPLPSALYIKMRVPATIGTNAIPYKTLFTLCCVVFDDFNNSVQYTEVELDLKCNLRLWFGFPLRCFEKS